MSESSNMKAPKKENSKNISIWWIILGLVIIALVFSIVAVVIALHYTNVQLQDYAQKDMFNNYAKKDDLDQYTKNDDFDGNCDRWADTTSKLSNYVEYGAEIHITSKKTSEGGGGNLSDRRPDAEFVGNSGDYEVMSIQQIPTDSCS